jgi:hypothetical protein
MSNITCKIYWTFIFKICAHVCVVTRNARTSWKADDCVLGLGGDAKIVAQREKLLFGIVTVKGGRWGLMDSRRKELIVLNF